MAYRSTPAIAACLLLACAAINQAPAQGEESPPAPVNTAVVEEGSFAQPVRLTGSVDPFEDSTLSSDLSGTVERYLVDEGDLVTSGTALLQLRQLPFELELMRAEADAREEAEILRELQAGTRIEDLEIAQANWQNARVAAEIASSEHERYTKLLADKSVSQSEYDSIRSRWETAVAEERVTKATLDRALVGSRLEQIGAQEARAASTAADASLMRDQLERSTIRAPFTGYITRRFVSQGMWLSPGDSVFQLQQLNPVKVTVQVPEIYFNGVKVGDELEVTFDSLPKEKFRGTVIQRIPNADTRSRAFPIRLRVENPDRKLATGMLARVLIQPPTSGDRSLIVQKDALVARYPKPIVFKVEQRDGKNFAVSVEVDTGRFFGEAVEVFGDLKAGDQVVIRGNERLQPDQPILLNTYTISPTDRRVIDPSGFFDESGRTEN